MKEATYYRYFWINFLAGVDYGKFEIADKLYRYALCYLELRYSIPHNSENFYVHVSCL